MQNIGQLTTGHAYGKGAGDARFLLAGIPVLDALVGLDRITQAASVLNRPASQLDLGHSGHEASQEQLSLTRCAGRGERKGSRKGVAPEVARTDLGEWLSPGRTETSPRISQRQAIHDLCGFRYVKQSVDPLLNLRVECSDGAPDAQRARRQQQVLSRGYHGAHGPGPLGRGAQQNYDRGFSDPVG